MRFHYILNRDMFIPDTFFKELYSSIYIQYLIELTKKYSEGFVDGVEDFAIEYTGADLSKMLNIVYDVHDLKLDK